LPLSGKLASLRSDMEDWCRGRSWIWRAPLLLYLTYTGVRYLLDPLYGSLFSGITLAIHELGHLVLAWSPRLLEALGGSLFQVAAPVAAAVVLYRQDDWFGVSVAGCWLSYSLFSLGTYIGDARARDVPLIGLSENPEHDWHLILSMVGMLPLDRALGFLTRSLALLVLAGSVSLGAWLCWRMAISSRSRGSES
jgi:hypothetical protein